MKKIAILLVLVMTLMLIGTSAQTVEAEVIQRGDANADGVVNCLDITAMELLVATAP